MSIMAKSKIQLLAVLYAVIIGFSFLFTKVALTAADPIDILAYRFAISFLAIGIMILVGWIKLDLRGKKLWRILPIGLIYPTLFFGFQVFGLMSESSSEGAVFQASAPVITMILASIFLKEKTTLIQKISVLCSVGGVIYILVMKGASINLSNGIGVTLLLLSSLSMAVYSVVVRSLIKKYTAIQMSFVMMLTGFISFSALAIVKHTLDGTWTSFLEPALHPKVLWSILYLGILSSLVSSLLSNYILSKLEASKMSVYVNLSIFVSILAGVIFLHEQLAYYHIIGAVVIVAGVLGVNYRPRKKQLEHE